MPPNVLAASLRGLNCFAKSLNASLVLNKGPAIELSSFITGCITLPIYNASVSVNLPLSTLPGNSDNNVEYFSIVSFRNVKSLSAIESN